MGDRSCVRCGHERLVELEMKVKGGQVLTMTSCSRCEERKWFCDGEPATQNDVLALTAGDPDFVLAERTTRKKPLNTRG